MFKFDRMNSSMLCMIRGKLCITIATAFTVTMATHLFLFMIFVDQQLIHGSSHHRDNRFPKLSPQVKSSSPVKRDIHQPRDISGELPRINVVPTINKSTNVVVTSRQKTEHSDIKTARKILGDQADNVGDRDDWWLGRALHAITRKLTGNTVTSDLVNTDGSKQIYQENVDKWSKRDQGGEEMKQVIAEENGGESDAMTEMKRQPLREVIFQEINIPPARLDDEWEAQDDWNMEHLIVAETKKSNPPNTKNTHKQPDSKTATKNKNAQTKVKPANNTGYRKDSSGRKVGQGQAADGYNKNINSYKSNKETNVLDNALNSNQQKPSIENELGDFKSQGQGYNGAGAIQNKATDPLWEQYSQHKPQRGGSPKTVMGKLVKPGTKTFSVVPKPVDAQYQRSADEWPQNRDNSPKEIVRAPQYRQHYNNRGLSEPIHSDINSNNINSRVKFLNSDMRDNVDRLGNGHDNDRQAILNQQEIQRLHQNYLQRRNRQ